MDVRYGFVPQCWVCKCLKHAKLDVSFINVIGDLLKVQNFWWNIASESPSHNPSISPDLLQYHCPPPMT